MGRYHRGYRGAAVTRRSPTERARAIGRDHAATYLTKWLNWSDHEAEKVRNGHFDHRATPAAFITCALTALSQAAQLAEADGWVMVPRDCTDEIAEAICGQVNVCGGIAESIWRAAMTAASAQAAQPAEADGWVMVPREPTEAMVEKFYAVTEITREGAIRHFAEGWSAMLAATPPAPNDDLRAAIREEVINTPETADFMAGVPLEAAHQRERWGVEDDAGKTPEDWFWLIGYLAQKALRAQNDGDVEKALHHTISTAAALANWHAAIAGVDTSMRPGIDPPAALKENRRG